MWFRGFKTPVVPANLHSSSIFYISLLDIFFLKCVCARVCTHVCLHVCLCIARVAKRGCQTDLFGWESQMVMSCCMVLETKLGSSGRALSY